MRFKYKTSILLIDVITNDNDYIDDFDKNNLPLIIHHFKTENKGNGEGTKLLQQVLAYSNKIKKDIIVQPWNSSYLERLRSFYIRNGFVDNGDYFIYYSK